MKINSVILCMCCGKELDNMEYDMSDRKIEVHPYDGLHFRSYGHYGSGIFDPMGTGETLDVAICDVCVMLHLDRVRGTGVTDLKDNYDMYKQYADLAVKHSGYWEKDMGVDDDES